MLSDGGSTAVGSSSTSIRAFRISAFAISTRCCAATGSSSTRVPRVEREARSFGERTQLRDRLLQVQRTVTAERDVLGDRHHRHECEMLVHHADAEGDRARRAVQPHRGATHLDGASVGAFHAVRDAHERGLPGAVLAQQGMHGAGAHAQRSRRQCARRAESLVDAL